VGVAQVRAIKVRPAKVRGAEVRAAEVRAAEVKRSEIEPRIIRRDLTATEDGERRLYVGRTDAKFIRTGIT
jgi:hypothetical protein